MERKDLARKLKSLCQLDIDAMHAYIQAQKHIDHPEIRETVAQFQADHGRHIQDLSDIIRSLSEEPPEFSKDFKGFLLEAFTRIRSASGNEGALKALKSGEELTNGEYRNAVEWDVSMEFKTLLERNYADEQRHLQYIETVISERLWEKSPVR